ncbi:MAG: diadenylate cyclase CdaA [Clostridia bacterium]|nr:diadenylate cyclase CdaA [Clostridia bacterium]
MWWQDFYHSAINQMALFRIADLIDIVVVSYLIYKALKFIRDTKTMQLLKGVVLLIFITQASNVFHLNAVYFILSNVLQLGLIALLIVFQPELRRILERVGRTSVSKWFNTTGEYDPVTMQTIREIARGAQAMANNKVGALIVIENDDNIDSLISSGISVKATTTSELLENIFVPNTPLHDGAVVIRNNKVELATCVLPLSQNPDIRQELGTRHRAGLGISEESDAVVVIVSEETGNISVAHKGALNTGFGEESLREKIIELLNDEFLTKETSQRRAKFKSFVKRGEDK